MPEKVALSKNELLFFSSGSTLLDLSLGGGWAVGRVFNIVGDKSSGKTLLAIEAFANFSRTFPNARMRYAEAEAAFDDVFAEQLGFPKTVERPQDMLRTVKDFGKDLFKFAEKGGPSLYILDSLDALSDESEVERFEARMADKEEKGSYGVGKPKEMSELFRTITSELGAKQCTLGIISQIRDRIGITFGETKTRSGGRALDFYASQVLWLAETGKLKKTVKGQDRVIGVSIHSKVKKNKCGVPFREADYPIIFSYGIDDEESMLDWLSGVGMAKETVSDITKQLKNARQQNDMPTIQSLKATLQQDTIRIWGGIEAAFEPPVRKYQ